MSAGDDAPAAPGREAWCATTHRSLVLAARDGDAAKSAVHRLRQRHRELRREEIARTVSGPEELAEEARHLIAVLGYPLELNGGPGAFSGLAFSPEDATLAACSMAGVVKLSRPCAPNPVMTLSRGMRWGTSLSFSVDGSLLAVGRRDKAVRLFRAATKAKAEILPP